MESVQKARPAAEWPVTRRKLDAMLNLCTCWCAESTHSQNVAAFKTFLQYNIEQWFLLIFLALKRLDS
jgi:hypothetical protein